MNSKSSPQCRFPQTYATVNLVNSNRQELCSFLGPDSIICVVTANDWAAVAVVEDLYTLRKLKHIGFSSHMKFKACLCFPGYGCDYDFRCTKAVDSYDVVIRFVEYH